MYHGKYSINYIYYLKDILLELRKHWDCVEYEIREITGLRFCITVPPYTFLQHLLKKPVLVENAKDDTASVN